VQTVATPHLGVRKYTFGIRFPSALFPLMGLLFGRSGTELFLNDSSDTVGEPTDANGHSNGHSNSHCCSDSTTVASATTATTTATDAVVSDSTAAASSDTAAAAATGSDAVVSDSATVGKPLLVRMACDREFLEPLLAFKRRLVYANYRGDSMVTLRTAAIEPEPLQEVVSLRTLIHFDGIHDIVLCVGESVSSL
jgi:Putative serine esterase (DUF676)